MSQRATSC